MEEHPPRFEHPVDVAKASQSQRFYHILFFIAINRKFLQVVLDLRVSTAFGDKFYFDLSTIYGLWGGVSLFPNE